MTEAAALLLQYIRQRGRISGQVIKVDTFLNHMVDPHLLRVMAEEIAGRFAGLGATKILTAETSGIMLAQQVAMRLNLPYVYAKKKQPITMTGCFSAESYSFTKQESTILYVSNEVLGAEDRVLVIDDFYARGATLKALCDIIDQAGARFLDAAVVINKSERRDIHAILTLDDLSELT